MLRVLFSLIFLMSTLGATPKAIIFDFGGVMTDVDRGPIINFISSSLKADAKHDLSGDKLYKALDEGSAFWQEYAASHDKVISLGWMLRLEELANQMVHPIAGMYEMVDLLKSQGYRVALLSNTTKARSLFFKNHGYYAPFDPIVLSCDVDVQKPNPKIYEIMLQKLRLPAEACLFIDNKKENTEAAKKLGFEVIHFKSPKQFKAELFKILNKENTAFSFPKMPCAPSLHKRQEPILYTSLSQ